MYKHSAAVPTGTVRAGQSFVTKDGFGVSSGLIVPADAKLLVDFFYKLSPLTIRERFKDIFNPPPMKEVWQLAKLLSGVDNQKHLALVASVEKSVGRRIVGIARYSVLENEPKTADAVIVVRDDFRHQGLGVFLLRQLMAEAYKNGFEKIVCTVPADNAPFLQFIENHGFEKVGKPNPDGFSKYELRIPVGDRAAA